MITEYSLHKFRMNPKPDMQNSVKKVLKAFRNQTKGKGLFQPRLYHLQAYFAYLRNKPNRAKLLLEDCVVASKDNDVTFDYEWALGSKRKWFINTLVEIDIEQQTSGPIKYILPVAESTMLKEILPNPSVIL